MLSKMCCGTAKTSKQADGQRGRGRRRRRNTSSTSQITASPAKRHSKVRGGGGFRRLQGVTVLGHQITAQLTLSIACLLACSTCSPTQEAPQGTASAVRRKAKRPDVGVSLPPQGLASAVLRKVRRSDVGRWKRGQARASVRASVSPGVVVKKGPRFVFVFVFT